MLRTVVFAVVLVLLGSSAHAEKRIALLIGNKGYAQAVGPLQNPHNDIAVVAKALVKIGFEIMPEVKDGTREKILFAVHDFADKLKSGGADAVGFLYYSGHGLASAGQNYLVPIDVGDVSTRVLNVKGVSHAEVLNILQDTAPQAAHYLVFDACRNNLGGARGGKGFVPELQRSGVMIAFAAAPGTTASDKGSSSGPYAKALAAELVRPGQSDLYMFHRIRVEVDRATRGDQVPWIEDGIRRPERILFGGKAKPKGPSEAEKAWALTKDTADIALLEAYVTRYKDSFYAEVARARIEELKKKPGSAAVSPKIERSPDRPFDGYWIVKAAAVSGCEQKGWSNRVAIQNFDIKFAEEKRGHVERDGTFKYTRPNRNYPDLVVTMSGKLSEQAGTGIFSTGQCKGTLVLNRE